MLDTIFFSSLFLHKERDKPDTGKGSLHYFSGIFLFIDLLYLIFLPPINWLYGINKKSIPEKFLSQYPSYLKEMFRKRKEKKIGGLRSVCFL